ncbi:unnamed protein product, partial [marine sediment metagenome]
YKLVLDNTRGGWGFEKDAFYIVDKGKKLKMKTNVAGNLQILCEFGFNEAVLLTDVIEPLMQLFFLRRGFSFIHASTVSKENGYCFCAFPRTGKTNTVLALMQEGYDFMSDDLSIINKEGMVFPYPCPISVKPHNLNALPSLYDKIEGSDFKKKRISLQEWVVSHLAPYYKYARHIIPASWVSSLVDNKEKVYDIKLAGIGQPSKISKLFLLIREHDSKVKIKRIRNMEQLSTRLSASLLFEHVWSLQNYFIYLFAFPDKRCGLLENSQNLQKEIILGALSKTQCYQINIPENVPFNKSFAEYRDLID